MVHGRAHASLSVPSQEPRPGIVDSSHHYPGLDGLRGIAILLVLSWNLAAQAQTTPGSIPAYAQALARLNWSGVDLFFVLSGFLIGGILLDHRSASNGLRVFYLRRACRIFPIYYASLLAFALAHALLGSRPEFAWLLVNQGVGGVGQGAPSGIPPWSYGFYVQNFWMASTDSWGPGWLGITWSLAIEEQFYLLLPLLVFLAPRRLLPFACGLVFLGAAAFRSTQGGLAAYCLLAARADALVAGVFVACLLREPAMVTRLAGAGRAVAAGVAVLALGFALLVLRPTLIGSIRHSFLAVFYAVLVAAVVLHPQLGPLRLAGLPALRWFGQISYGLYLFHEPVMGALHAAIYHAAPRLRNPAEGAVSCLALALCVLLASLSYRYFERPLVAFGRRHRYLEAA